MSKGGRPTIYTPELATEICSKIAQGKSLREICRAEGMPEASTVHLWVLKDLQGFSEQYATSRRLQAEMMADELLEITDDSRNDWMERQDGSTVINSEHVSRSRLRVDTRKWILSKVLPKVYGDKISAEVTGKDGAALVPSEVRIVLVSPEKAGE